MAPDSNWLSFSLSSMDMLNNSSHSSMLQLAPSFDASPPPHSQHYYNFADNFYAHGWSNTKTEEMYAEGDKVEQNNINGESYMFQNFVDSQIHQQQPPKLEDFLGGETETTQDSSLTHMYNNIHTDQQQHQDLENHMAVGFQTFSTNSGSEVDDSQVNMGYSIESNNELGYSQPKTNMSLAVNTTSEKAIVAVVDSENCKKITDTFGQRTSIYRGVTRHRWTGRYEAHLWDNSCRREGQARKGRQVYLGGYDKEDKAARAYDLAALKYWGATATTNFPVSSYAKEVEEMAHMTKQEFIASLRRKSSGFSRGASIYRGVTRHHQQGRWQARIGRVAGNKDLYLGTFATEEEAAEAYDIAAIKFRGVNAVTNFEMNRYDVEAIMKSSLPIGGAAKRLKISLESEQKQSHKENHDTQVSGGINFGAMPPPPISSIPYGIPFDTNQQPFYHHNYFFHPLQSNTDAASSTMPLIQSPAEIFIWPHQSY